jgi:hypothetical protein
MVFKRLGSWAMKKMGIVCIAALVFSNWSFSSEALPSVVSEMWDAAFLEGNQIGFFHTTTREVELDGKKLLRTTLEMDLTIKRYNAVARLRMENGTEETESGKVLAVFMTQYLDAGQKLILKGIVEDDQLHVTVDSGRIDKKIPWNDDVIGLHKQERLFEKSNANPGDKIKYFSYEPTLNTVVTVRAVVKEKEQVECLGKMRSLIRVESKPDKVQVSKGEPIQLPGMITWLDKDYQPVRQEMAMPGMGTIILYRTNKARAQAPVATLGKQTDLGLSTLVSLNRAINKPYETSKAVYRITLKDDSNPATAFARDDRQEIKKVKGNTFELHVKAIKEPTKDKQDQTIDKEFLASCYFLDSDAVRIRNLAKRAIGEQTDDWQKAKRIENWVYKNVENDNSIPFCPASQVASKLRGDCRQHSMLAAALCRAASVPARTAVGLIYVDDRKKGPVLGFHMWDEVWVNGQWVSIDPTFGPNSVGATHLKIADHSWSETQSLTPLLPVARVLGKLTIEVISVEGERK